MGGALLFATIAVHSTRVLPPTQLAPLPLGDGHYTRVTPRITAATSASPGTPTQQGEGAGRAQATSQSPSLVVSYHDGETYSQGLDPRGPEEMEKLNRAYAERHGYKWSP